MHFRPSEIPEGKKTLVMMAFGIHIAIFVNTLLSVIDNIAIGGLSKYFILSVHRYSLFDIIFLHLQSYRVVPFLSMYFLSLSLLGHIGLCK